VDKVIAVSEENGFGVPVNPAGDEHILFEFLERLLFESQVFVHRAKNASVPRAPTGNTNQGASGLIGRAKRWKIVISDRGHRGVSLHI
jgi:hypothetical protein